MDTGNRAYDRNPGGCFRPDPLYPEGILQKGLPPERGSVRFSGESREAFVDQDLCSQNGKISYVVFLVDHQHQKVPSYESSRKIQISLFP